MIKIIISAVLVSLFTLGVQAQNDTMYVWKDGTIVGQYNVNTEVDSVTFSSPSLATNDSVGIFTDFRDGNTYNWVIIGDQVWMAENLKYLPSVNNLADGSEDMAGSYYYVYGYDGTDVSAVKATSNYDTYGVLYNWTAAMEDYASSSTNPSGIQGVCPSGWHLPSDAEWTQLTDYLDCDSVAGGKLKDIGTDYWNSLDTSATNATGFTALPGGSRGSYESFDFIGIIGSWWSTSEYNASSVWYRYILSSDSLVYRDDTSTTEIGQSVRCIRD